MCSSPRPKKTYARSQQNALELDIDQTSYSSMIRIANSAYEKRHPESDHKPAKQTKPVTKKNFSSWIDSTKLTQYLKKHISIN